MFFDDLDLFDCGKNSKFVRMCFELQLRTTQLHVSRAVQTGLRYDPNESADALGWTTDALRESRGRRHVVPQNGSNV